MKKFKITEVHFDNNPMHEPEAPEFSRLIATMDGDGQFTVNIPSIYPEDCVGLLAAIAQGMEQLTEQNSENLLMQARKSVRWNRRGEKVKRFGLAQ